MILAVGWISHAISVGAAGGITVAPGYVRMNVTKANPVRDATVTVRNDFSVPVTLEATLSDIDQKKGVLVPTDQPDSELSRFVEINPSIFELQPSQAINIQLRLTDSPKLGPGGHYGALVIKQTPIPGSNIPIRPAVSVSLFIIKEDGAIRQIALKSLDMSGMSVSLPKTLDMTFQNAGNVDVVPKALVLLAGRDGTVYAKGVVNEESVPVFPNNQVILRSNLTTLQKTWKPGRYSFYVQYRHDGQVKTTTYREEFFYAPWWFILIVLILLNAFIIGFFKIDRKKWRKRFAKRLQRIQKWSKDPKIDSQKAKKITVKSED